MRGAWRALRRFWESDRGLSVFLGLLVVFLFVLPPLVEPEGHGRSLIVDLGLSVLLLAGVAAVSPPRAVRALLFVLVVGALVVRWGPFSAPATAAAALVTVVAMTFVVLGQAFRAGPVNVHRIQGAVAAYLLLGLAWALAYETLALVADGGVLLREPGRAREGPLHLLQLRHPDDRGVRRRDAGSPRGALAGRGGGARGTALPGHPARPPRLAGDGPRARRPGAGGATFRARAGLEAPGAGAEGLAPRRS